MSSIDKVIARDLAALGENSRRDVPALDEALRTTDAYRDDRPGAEARRDALAEERRRELVLMPLTLAHVFAHRVGRIAAGGMAILVSIVMLAMLADPLLMRFAAWFVPGLNVGMLIVLAALKIVAAYVVATWIGEVWFARRMRKAIETGGDAYRDLEQLAQGPIDLAQRAVRRVDGWALGLLLAGAASVTLVFGYTVMVVGLNHTLSHAWSMIGILETGALERNVGTVAFGVLASCTAGLLAGRACARSTRLDADPVTRALGSWMALVVAGVIGIVMLYNVFHLAVNPGLLRRLPSAEERYGLAIGGTISVVLPLAWGLLFWRRREQARIGD